MKFVILAALAFAIALAFRCRPRSYANDADGPHGRSRNGIADRRAGALETSGQYVTADTGLAGQHDHAAFALCRFSPAA